MPRIRYIKPEAFTDEELGALPAVVRWFYAGLWTQADCEGVLEDKPGELKLKLIPYDEESGEDCLAFLTAAKKVVRYRVGARRLLWVPTLKHHQRFHKDEKPKGLPLPPEDVVSNYLLSLQDDAQQPVSTVPAPGQHEVKSTGTGNGDGEDLFAGEPQTLAPRGAKKAKKAKEVPNPRHTPLKARLFTAFREITGRDYAWQGGRDAKGIDMLLTKSSDDDEIVLTFRVALRRVGYQQPKDIFDFADKYNLYALPQGAGPPKDVRKGTVRAEDQDYSTNKVDARGNISL